MADDLIVPEKVAPCMTRQFTCRYIEWGLT